MEEQDQRILQTDAGHDDFTASSYFHTQNTWNSKLFGCFTGEFQIAKVGNWIKPFLLCAPCFLVGWSESCRHREEEQQPPGSFSLGMGPKGKRACGQSCWQCMFCSPLFAFKTIQARSHIMQVYGISGGKLEKAKGMCCPCALMQHLTFLREQSVKGSLRFHWETGDTWSLKDRPPELRYKILILGSGGVGKSSLFHLLLGQTFPLPYHPDCHAHLGVKAVHAYGYPDIMAELWDIPASTKIDMQDIFFKDAMGAFVLFELDSYITWKEAKSWMEALTTSARTLGRNSVTEFPITVVGSKTDICSFQECRFISEVEVYVQEHENMDLKCVSSWKKEGIDLLLRDMCIHSFDASTQSRRHPSSPSHSRQQEIVR